MVQACVPLLAMCRTRVKLPIALAEFFSQKVTPQEPLRSNVFSHLPVVVDYKHFFWKDDTWMRFTSALKYPETCV
jgi:hypothetical protein